MKKKLQKSYLTHYNILTVQDLWHVHYQILFIISLREFIKLKVNIDLIIKNVKRVELNVKIVTAVSNGKVLKMV